MFGDIEIEKKLNFTAMKLFRRCGYWDSVSI